jgi:zinc transport system substrate-binding protein
MKRITFLLFIIAFLSCNRHQGSSPGERIITVSIAPYKYFVEAIADSDFVVNIMVPPGSDPHVYEPVPDQIVKLKKSEGYISNGYLGFEMIWLSRFYEVNRRMEKLSLDANIEPIVSTDHHEGDHVEGADPHYWVSPQCAMKMAASVRDFLSQLNPKATERYRKNCDVLLSRIGELDKKASSIFSAAKRKSFMIYHPNLAYLARDYGLKEISVETDGKEPSPSGMKSLVDEALAEGIHTVFLQREYDPRNARAVAAEIGAEIVVIDPLSADWLNSTSAIIDELGKSLNQI